MDRDVVVCRSGINTLLTGRGPADLDAFCDRLSAELEAAPTSGRARGGRAVSL